MIGSIVCLHAQNTITGTVYNSKREALNAASILVKESNTGVTTDSSGNFTLNLSRKGRWTLETSSVGYITKELVVDIIDSTIHVDILLKDQSKMLGEVVVISAGSFEASDKAKGASLTPMDAVTVAGSGGDLANALRSLPG